LTRAPLDIGVKSSGVGVFKSGRGGWVDQGMRADQKFLGPRDFYVRDRDFCGIIHMGVLRAEFSRVVQ